MARKTAKYLVKDEGRDKGKVFFITEMGAFKAEAWAMRCLLALMAGNVNLPENFQDMSMAAIAELGLRAITDLKWEVAQPLLAEMMECVERIPDPKKPAVMREIVEEDFEEVLTIMKVRAEVFQLHVGFLNAAFPSLGGAAKKAAGRSQDTQTSLE